MLKSIHAFDLDSLDTNSLSIPEMESITTSDEDNTASAKILHKETKSWKQKLKSSQRSRSSSPSEYKPFVYMYNVPTDIEDDVQLARLIHKRLKETLQISPINVECYWKLGAGRMRVRNDKIKDRLVTAIGKIVWNPKDDTHTISFTDTFQFVSFIVLNVTDNKKNVDLPKPEEIVSEWIKVYNAEKPRSCDQVNIQFPNIYRIVSTSYDELPGIIPTPVFNINNLIAQVYLGAYCSYFEDLSKSTTEDKLREAIGKVIGLENISRSSLHIELNKQSNNACIIASNTARKWATKNFIYLGDKPTFKKEDLTYRLHIRHVSEIYNIDGILNHQIFDGKARIVERRGENLIVEVSDKNIFDNCLKFGVFRPENKSPLFMELYTTLSDPRETEIDNDTWYEDEMIRYKPDIMQFVANPDHHIFHYKWNSKIWLQQFKRAISHKYGSHSNIDSRDRRGSSIDQMYHLLQMTVMLNTIGVIRKKSYMINDHQVILHLDPKLETIVYNHASKLEHAGPIPLTKTPFTKTDVQVVNEDCIVIYKNCIEKYEKPLLLNLANATNPGGGYRKGGRGQEENLFRRSDYFRSLDIDLDGIQQEIPERLYCSCNCQLNPLSNSSTMYPIDEFGALYTSGLTFFRKSEDEGYDYMEEPLKGVCSLAMPVYREPKLDGNMLAPKCAVGMRKKIENMFAIAYHHKHDCLILSDLGFAAFGNPSDHVAKLFRSVIEQYAGFFQSIIFATVNNRHKEQQNHSQDNFKSFKNELDGIIVQSILPFNRPNTMLGPYRFLSDGVTVSDICIYDLTPCHFGATCQDMYDSNHTRQFSHPPLCIQALIGTCTQNHIVHMSSFIHRNPCKYGVQCRNIDDTKHAQEFEHPSYCPQGGNCQDTSDNHEKAYRHLPLCKHSHKCIEFRKRTKSHCETFRHYMPYCEYGSHCINFHDKKHLEYYKHPFSPPCSFTPYHCALHEELSATKDTEQLSDEIYQHCLEFSHVCRFGENCTNKDPYHLEKSIHIRRPICSFGEKCDKIAQEDHLNSFTHPNIRDIRILCKYADKCRNHRDPKHISKFRHAMLYRDAGVVRYYNLNKNIDFIQNQKDNIERVIRYVQSQKWNRFPSKSIPKNIIDWIRTVQPVHRCKPDIFESILVHGHVMSRNYMDNLKKIPCVVHSILHHNRIQQIETLKKKIYADYTADYVTALVTAEFDKNLDGTVSEAELLSPEIKNKEVILSSILSPDDMKAIKTTATNIAQASIKLHSNPAGIGYKPDQDLGTNKNVFSILGSHSGQYGDIFIVFKRDILHHPDANFTIQAATSYASGNAFKWRPWLGPIPNSKDQQIDLFHTSKLHAAVPGYEYATAIELIAVASHTSKKNTMDISLKKILKVWQKLNSHQTIEAHLPQLIPLDYIEHIYMTKDIFDKFNKNIRQVIKVNFDNRITIKSFQTKEEYQNFVNKELIDRFGQRDTHSLSRPIRGFIITIPSTNFTDHFAIPLTISQSYAQYRINHPNTTSNLTIYIYWQVMNGDVMLTLSNEQIDTGQLQPKLNCLICYLARKPSTKDTHYHEDASYLNSGLPFQHQIFIDENKYAAKSTSFYVGCNTDDLMTFCLEIHRSTGQVILSHSGPNSIYNHEKISCTFDKANLDLTQLDFVHLSAGTCTVPIRNLIITFEKESEPLDGSTKNPEHGYIDVLPDSICNMPFNNDSMVSSESNTVDQYTSSSALTSQSMAQNMQIPRQLIERSVIFVFGLLILYTIAHIFVYDQQTITNYLSIPLIIIKPFLFITRFCWSLLIILISEIMINKKLCPNYIQKYQLVKEKVKHWCGNNKIKGGIIVIFILVGSFLLELFLQKIIITFINNYMLTAIMFLKKSLIYSASIFVCYCLFRLIYR